MRSLGYLPSFTSKSSFLVSLSSSAPSPSSTVATPNAKTPSTTSWSLSTPALLLADAQLAEVIRTQTALSEALVALHNLYDGPPSHADVNTEIAAVRVNIRRRLRTLPDLIGGRTVLALNDRIETVKGELEGRMEDNEADIFELQRVTGLRRRPFPDDRAEEEDRQRFAVDEYHLMIVGRINAREVTLSSDQGEANKNGMRMDNDFYL